MSDRPKVIAVLGSTASGKSQLAHALALHKKGVILSCDSAQVYRGFDIGTAKPTAEDREEVKYFGLDLVDHAKVFDAGQYAEYGRKIFEENKTKMIFVVGGTGLYFRSLVGEVWDDLPSDAAVRESFKDRSSDELYLELKTKDSERAKTVHHNDRFRIERALEVMALTGKKVSDIYAQEKTAQLDIELTTIVLDPPRDVLLQRIAERTKKMLASGLVEEVERLRSKGVPKEAWPMQTIGYASVNAMLEGELTLEKLEGDIVQQTQRYAKRQRTWFSKSRCDLLIATQSALNPDHFLSWTR